MSSLSRRLASAMLVALLLATAPAARAGNLSDIVNRLRDRKEIAGVDLKRSLKGIELDAHMNDNGIHAGTKWTLSGDMVEVDIPGYAHRYEDLRTRKLRVIYQGGNPAVAVAFLNVQITSNDAQEWKDLEDLEPLRLDRWTSRFGCLYTTRVEGIYLSIPGPDQVLANDLHLRLIRFLAPGALDSGLAGKVVVTDDLAAPIQEAAKREDMRAVRRILGDLERPRASTVRHVYDELEQRDPSGRWLKFDSLAANAGDWEGRLTLLDAVRARYRYLTALAKSEERVPAPLRHPIDLAAERAHLEPLLRKALPADDGVLGVNRVLREVLVRRAFGDAPDSSSIRDWTDRFQPYVSNLEAVRAERTPIGDIDPFAKTLLNDFNVRWTNRADGAKATVELLIGAMDPAALTTGPSKRIVTKGAWVNASTDQLAQQGYIDGLRRDKAGAAARLAEIEQELHALDWTPMGKEVKGGAEEVVIRKVEDAQGATHDIVVSRSAQNVYRTGVAKDARDRAARRQELKEEQNRLRALQNESLEWNAASDGKVWDPKGGSAWEEGFTKEGECSRWLALDGDGIAVREKQVRKIYAFREDQGQLGDPAILAAVETEFDGAAGDPSYTRSGEPLRVHVNKMLLRAVGEMIDREARSASASAEERAWTRAIFGLDAPPVEGIYRFMRSGG